MLRRLGEVVELRARSELVDVDEASCAVERASSAPQARPAEPSGERRDRVVAIERAYGEPVPVGADQVEWRKGCLCHANSLGPDMSKAERRRRIEEKMVVDQGL